MGLSCRSAILYPVSHGTENGFSQRALAKKLDMTQPQLVRLEAGEHNPTIATLARLAQTLDIEFAIDVPPPPARVQAPQWTRARPKRHRLLRD